MARFRCCGNHSTAGHAAGCPMKPPDYQPPPQTAQTITKRQEQEQGCQFDIFRFQHIGDCKGTCGEEQEPIRFFNRAEQTVVLVMINADDPDAEERMKKLEAQGFKRLSLEEIAEIAAAYDNGELQVTVVTMTLDELEEVAEQIAEQPEDPFLSVNECAKLLGFSKGWIRELCRRGKFEGAIKLDRRWAIPQSAILLPD